MRSSTPREVEQSIWALPLREQLWLLERLAGHLREKTEAARPVDPTEMEEQLAAMANDPAIQREFRAIRPRLGRLPGHFPAQIKVLSTSFERSRTGATTAHHKS